MNIQKAAAQHRPAVVALLETEQLPVADLPTRLDHFWVALAGEEVVGAIGLEPYEHGGLLRSLAVKKAYRNQNIATLLVQALEKGAAASGIQTLYLLTETAPRYFEQKGFEKISRSEVPTTVQASSEFSHVCPASAIVLKKEVNR